MKPRQHAAYRKKSEHRHTFPPAVASPGKRLRSGSAVPQYPKCVEDIKHLFLPKSEFLRLKSMIQHTVQQGGFR